MIEVRYAGVVVGRSAIIRELDTRGLFLSVTEPLPVGTPVVLRIGDHSGAEEVRGRVELVSESPELSNAGMRVRFADPSAAVLFGTPIEAPPEPPSFVSAPLSGPTRLSTLVPEKPVQAVRPQAPPEAAAVPIPVPVAAAVPRSVSAAAPVTGPVTAAPIPVASISEEGDFSAGAAMPDASGPIPAPEPTAFGGQGGGKKNRRNRRR